MSEQQALLLLRPAEQHTSPHHIAWRTTSSKPLTVHPHKSTRKYSHSAYTIKAGCERIFYKIDNGARQKEKVQHMQTQHKSNQ